MSKLMYTILTGLALTAGLGFTGCAHSARASEMAGTAKEYADPRYYDCNSYAEAINLARDLEKQGFHTRIDNIGGGRHRVTYW